MALEPAEMCSSNKMLQVLLKMINVSKAVCLKKKKKKAVTRNMTCAFVFYRSDLFPTNSIG